MSAPDPQEIEAILSEVCLSMTSNSNGSRDLLSQLEFVADLIHRAPNPLPKAPSLLVASVASDKEVKVVPLERSVKIGRSPECEVSFPGLREVSRMHCEIVPLGTGHMLRDTDSYNGTYVAGKDAKIVEHHLRDGDLIKIGDLRFVYLNQ